MAFVEDPFSAISWFVCQLRVELGFRLFARNGFDTYAIQAQHKSLFSHLQLLGSFKHDEHIIAPHPTQVLLNLLQPQCLHSSIVTIPIRPIVIIFYREKFQTLTTCNEG
jgi:hypothetical protein